MSEPTIEDVQEILQRRGYKVSKIVNRFFGRPVCHVEAFAMNECDIVISGPTWAAVLDQLPPQTGGGVGPVTAAGQPWPGVVVSPVFSQEEFKAAREAAAKLADDVKPGQFKFIPTGPTIITLPAPPFDQAALEEAMSCIIEAMKAIPAGAEDNFVNDMARQAEAAMERAFLVQPVIVGQPVKCPVCHVALYDDAAKVGYCTDHEPVRIGKDGRCQCSPADPCPLGKVGSTLRCTSAELVAANVKVATEV